MGNRATVQFIDATEPAGVTVYLHWNGDDVMGWLKAAAPRMRRGDYSYAAARFIGYCHEQIDGGLSLGVLPGSAAYAGEGRHYVVDCSTGIVTLNGQAKRHVVKLGAF